ncbi:ABC transporter ATP-binding protein [Clostridium sp. 19966]|uniref:ABC transporter ATP-binding protein n=1 Tax=Clostridium sp. 19966 TaxID=2768166 RepID=UPI0028DF68C7|nr:ABC transporter ATP-binding protein [Clostridium sp. 19966]MDT8715119.1 ABC transporter ATP-binding protein [Clostridium sp. 19966]
MNNVVIVKNLEKNYGNKKAVGGIDFQVREGEIIGLLGPNGAGKSTTISILSTILSADRGEISILGYSIPKEVNKIKKIIGIVPQDLAIYEELSAEKNVRFFASLYGVKGKQLEEQVEEALELVGLLDKKGDKPKTFSGGMKRRLNIACAIAHNPKLIIMDEPTVGIDPQSRNHILESIKTLQKRGATVIYSTHYMEEVETICDRIIIMNEGKIIAEGTKEELKHRVNDDITYIFFLNEATGINTSEFNEIIGVKKVKLEEKSLIITAEKSKDSLEKIMVLILKQGRKIQNMSSQEASLETVFLELTGRNLRD